MHIWMITATEPIPSDEVRPMRLMGLANVLIERGHEVTIWATSFFHHTKAHRFPQDVRNDLGSGYREVVLKSWGYKKNISLQRLAAHWHFGARLRRRLDREVPPDAILTSIPTLDTAAVAVNYGLQAKVPVILDIIDPWPDVFLKVVPQVLRPLVRLMMGPFFKQARHVLQNATAVTALSKTYLRWAESMAGGTLRRGGVFYPAVDIAFFDELAARVPKVPRGGTSRPICFTYAGSLGHTYDVETIVNCARLLEESGFTGAEFRLAGSGPKSGQLQEMAKDLPNVKLLGWLGAEKLAELFVHSHVGLAAYSRDATQVVTYKLFDYLAAGLPILCSLRGEMASLLKREDIGMTYNSEDAAGLADLVKKICAQPEALNSMARRCRAFAERIGDAKKIYTEMATFLETVIKDSFAANPR